MFINELIACVHLLWVGQISFGHLRNKGVFEVYWVVKGLSGRELSCFGFVKHLSILGILRGKFQFNFLSSLGQRGGEGELPCRRVIFSEYSPSQGPEFLLLTDGGCKSQVVLLAGPKIS